MWNFKSGTSAVLREAGSEPALGAVHDAGFFLAARRAPVRRVLIYRLGSLGDTVVALPCFHRIARRWPDAERVVLTNQPVSAKAAPLESVLGRGDLIHGTIAYPLRTRSLTALRDVVRQIRAFDADVLVYLAAPRGVPRAVRDLLFFRAWCGIRTIVGRPITAAIQRLSPLVAARARRAGGEEYECERLARSIHALGPMDLDDPSVWDLRLTPREAQVARAALTPLGSAPFVAINMGGKAVEKDWGPSNWLTLLTLLARAHPHLGLLIVGAAEDGERAQQASAVWSGPVVDLCGKATARQTAAAMQGACGFIGHDSGPLHLAAAVGVRCVGLYGNFNKPHRWHPRGAQHRIIHRMSGIGDITVSEVERAVSAVMGDPVPHITAIAEPLRSLDASR